MVSETRKQVFLEHLKTFGIPVAAAKAASPLASDRHGAFSSFRDLAKRDAGFALAWQAAQEEANAELERTAYDRAVTGVNEPIYQAGERMVDEDGNPAVIVRYSDRLLERLLARRMPQWREKRGLEVSGGLSGTVECPNNQRRRFTLSRRCRPARLGPHPAKASSRTR